MPIYEYICSVCGHSLDALQKITDPPLVDCPACGKPEVRKGITAAAFRLKGTGWYETDFKHSGKKKPAGKDGKSDTAKGASGGAGKKEDSSGSGSSSSSASSAGTSGSSD